MRLLFYFFRIVVVTFLLVLVFRETGWATAGMMFILVLINEAQLWLWHKQAELNIDNAQALVGLANSLREDRDSD